MKHLTTVILSLALGAPLAAAPVADLQDPAPDSAETPDSAERQKPEKTKEKDAHARRAERAHSEKQEQRVASGKVDPVERELAREESEYRRREARLERMREIYQEKGETEKVARIDELRKKNDQLREKRFERLRKKHGTEKVDVARQKMHERVSRMDEETRKKRQEHIQSQKDKKGETIKGRDPKEVRDRRKDTPRNERKRPGGGGSRG